MSEQFVALCWEPTPPPRPTMQSIIERVAEKHGITVEDIKDPKRNRCSRRYAWPRHEFFYEAHMIGRSYPQAGAFCGGRDHTTALHGKREHEKRLNEGLLPA